MPQRTERCAISRQKVAAAIARALECRKEASQEIVMTRRLYVGNLPYDATEKQIRQVFETEERKVVSIKIVTDRDTGRPRGFAFVDLDTDEQAKVAIEQLNGKDFGGRALIVNEAEDKGPQQGKTGFRNAFGGGGHEDRGAKGGFGMRGPGQQMPRGSQRGGGRGGTRGS
jgi:cold-inducible RNA-binding protein